MEIKKMRKAVMGSMGLMKSTTDTTIKEIWRNLDVATQEKYLEKAKGVKNVTNIDDRKLSSSPNRTRRDRKPTDVPVPVP